MSPELTVATERMLLLLVVQRLGLSSIFDRHLGRHGLHQGLNWGWLTTIWLAHMTQSA